MVSIDMLFAYLLAVIIIVAIPGPNIILIVNDSVRYGFKQSVYTILGVKAGIALLFLLSLSGLAALLALFSWMFVLIKWAGVCYLIYLGLSQIRASFKDHVHKDTPAFNSKRFFYKGFLVSATNPKGLLFAGAFFPQFLDNHTAMGPQIAVLCGGFLLISFLIEIVYAYAGDTTGRIVKTERFKQLTERISGAVLVMFGIGLSFAKKNA